MPTPQEIEAALQSSKGLASLLKSKRQDFTFAVKKGKDEINLSLSRGVIELLLSILTQMAEGNAITLIPISAELSSQEAANLLNVSRPYLIRLLEEGAIPYHKIGTHRRIKLTDLLAYKKKMKQESHDALEELTKEAQDLDMGY